MKIYSIIILLLLITDIFVFANPQPIKILQHFESESTFAILKLKFTADGKHLISAGLGVNIWGVENWEKVSEISASGRQVAISNDDSLISFGGFPAETNLFDLQSGELIHMFEGHKKIVGSGRNQYASSILALSISDSNRYLVTVSNDQTAILWDLESKELIHQFTIFVPGTAERTGFEVSNTIFSPDESLIAFGHSFFSTSTYAKVFDFDPATISYPNSPIIKFSSSGKYFYSSEFDGTLRIWDWEQQSLIYNEKVHDYWGFRSDITSDDKYLITVGSDKNIHLIDLQNSKIIQSFEYFKPTLEVFPAITIHPTSKYFAVSVNDGNIYIYDLQEIIQNQSNIKEWNEYE